MTELIIIGNGFDLAHGMKTAYSDYIRAMLLDALSDTPKYGWRSPFDLGNIMGVLRTVGEHNLIAEIERLFNEPQNFGKKIQDKSSEQPRTLTELYQEVDKTRHYTRSPLVSLLIEDFEKKGWVDLEQSYFDILCQSHKDKGTIKQLNDDMTLLEASLHFYLKEIKPTHRSLAIKEHINNIKQAIVSTIENSQLELSLVEQKPVILNFNYTSTIGLYLKKGEYINIPIHGTLEDYDIVLGYGDETCEMYKTLENANDNELLKYFKSFYYMQNSRYRDLEHIISSDKFRIHIMGHSCGLSDKVLLSHLFNHENLDTIRIYYHEKEAWENDFFEKCQNISRLALDKHRIRCKILPPSLDLTDMERSVALVPLWWQGIEDSDS